MHFTENQHEESADVEPVPTESQVLVGVARGELERLSPAAQDEVRRSWDSLPEWRKQDLRDEAELDML